MNKKESSVKKINSFVAYFDFWIRSKKQKAIKAVEKKYIQTLEINTMLKIIEEISLKKKLKNILFAK